MKKLFNLNLLIALAVVFASCGTNNNVVNNRLISKRKYNKGFHINRKGNMKSSRVEKEEESVAFEDVKSTKKNQGKANYASTRTQDQAKVETTSNETDKEEVVVKQQTSTNKSVHRGQVEDFVNDEEVPFGEAQAPEDTESSDDLSSSDERMTTKEAKKARYKKAKRASNSDVMTILLVILALFIAPLAVGIYEGITTRFWITLILWLVGIGVGFWLLGGALAWLCGLAAAIYAILIVLGVI